MSIPELNVESTWGDLMRGLAALEADGEHPLQGLGEAAPGDDRPVGEALLEIVLARDEEALRFLHPEAARLAAVEIVLERALPCDLRTLTRHLRSHRFYDGETDAVVERTERLHTLALRPYLGLDGEELVATLEEKLFGRRTDLDGEIAPEDLQDIRLVAFAVKQLTAFHLPPEIRTLRDLGREILVAGH